MSRVDIGERAIVRAERRACACRLAESTTAAGALRVFRGLLS